MYTHISYTFIKIPHPKRLGSGLAPGDHVSIAREEEAIVLYMIMIMITMIIAIIIIIMYHYY